MSEQKKSESNSHTREPWSTEFGEGWYKGTRFIVNADTAIMSDSDVSLPAAVKQANAERIVACVNGCTGINPEAVPNLLRALENLAGAQNGEPCNCVGGDFRAECAYCDARRIIAEAKGRKKE
jgi:hypothetical protein